MMDNVKIDRINTLAHKAKKCRSYRRRKERTGRTSTGISWLPCVKNLRAQLNNIDIQEKDGSIVNLGEKYGRKKGN